jgi:protease-4
VVEVVAKRGGLGRALMFILGLMMFGIVFAIGIAVGMGIMFAGANYEDTIVEQHYRDGNRGTIAILPISGTIDQHKSEFVRAAVKHILDDRKIQAVVLRVDSPGGAVTPSDEIWNEINRLKNASLPVIASYGSLAASGGYYVSCGSDYIVAEETCITGSIGVIAQILTLQGLMDKIGVQPVTLVAHGSPQKNVANDVFRNWTDADKQKILTVLDSAYQTFATRVRDGRKNAITDPSKIDSLANGSIYTAKQALDSGLIDAVGYLDDAIAKAEKSAGLGAGSATVVMLKQPPSLFNDGLFSKTRAATGGLDADELRGLVNELAAPRIMYLMN